MIELTQQEKDVIRCAFDFNLSEYECGKCSYIEECTNGYSIDKEILIKLGIIKE